MRTCSSCDFFSRICWIAAFSCCHLERRPSDDPFSFASSFSRRTRRSLLASSVSLRSASRSSSRPGAPEPSLAALVCPLPDPLALERELADPPVHFVELGGHRVDLHAEL